MRHYFLNYDGVNNAGNDGHIVLLTFFAFGNVNIEYSPQTLGPRHRASISYVDYMGGDYSLTSDRDFASVSLSIQF
jgi:hypothetical protein